MWNRREWMQAGLALPVAAAPSTAWLQTRPEKLTILCHRVHRAVLTGEKGGDATAAWSKRNGIAIEWVTLDTGPLHERLFREASLGSTGIDIAFLLNAWGTAAADLTGDGTTGSPDLAVLLNAWGPCN